MKFARVLLRSNFLAGAVFSMLLVACGGGSSPYAVAPPPPPQSNADFQNVSVSNLPVSSLGGFCMDVDYGDVDSDGDIEKSYVNFLYALAKD